MNNIDFKFQDFSPYFLQEGVFGATLNRENESPIFLRMELLTKDNFTSWKKFKEMNDWVANCHSRGVLSNLIRMAGESRYPNYETIKEVTGFTYQEYEAFTEKAVKLKSQNDKIANIIAHNCVGSNHMVTSFEQGKLRYIVYASKNPTFSIQDAYKHIISNPCNLKNYITAYSDILITMGTDFSENDYFHNRGISRNPYWVFEGKYAGLSILLHGFTGVVANTYFPEKKFMQVKPVGSMQSILKNHLLPKEGFTERSGKTLDLTTLEIDASDPEGEITYIQTTALKRIFEREINKSKSPNI